MASFEINRPTVPPQGLVSVAYGMIEIVPGLVLLPPVLCLPIPAKYAPASKVVFLHCTPGFQFELSFNITSVNLALVAVVAVVAEVALPAVPAVVA
jgi:hypothetical protein